MKYKNIIFYVYSLFMFLSLCGVNTFVHAQGQTANFSPTIQNTSQTNTPTALSINGDKSFAQFVADFVLKASYYVLRLLIALCVFVLLFGIMKYMFKGQGSDSARTQGRALMLWGIIGLFSIASIWGLVSIVSSLVGHTDIIVPQFRSSQ